MKKILLFSILGFLSISCLGNSNYNEGDTVEVSSTCIGAIDEKSFDLMTSKCNHEDEVGLENMERRGLIKIIEFGNKGKITKTKFGKVKIRLENGKEYWCADEFILAIK